MHEPTARHPQPAPPATLQQLGPLRKLIWGLIPSRAVVIFGKRVVALHVLVALLVATSAARPSSAAPASTELNAQDGSAERGQSLFAQNCAICHTMSGGSGGGIIGPDLLDYASRPLIAETVPNTVENLVRFIVDPPGVKPGAIMPQLGLSTAQAADLAAFLLALPDAGAVETTDMPLE